MANEQLLSYIKQQLKLGMNKELIRSSLIVNGWQSQDIAEAFQSLSSSDSFLSQNSTPIQPVSSLSQKKGKKTFLIAICAVGSLLVILGGVFAYIKLFQSPEAILQKMFAAISEIKTLEYSGETKVVSNMWNMFSEKATSNSSVIFSGTSNIQNLENLKGQFMFNIKTDALSREEFSFESEIRSVSKIFYIRLNNSTLTTLGIYYFGLDLKHDLELFDSGATNELWVKIYPGVINEKFGIKDTEEQLNKLQTNQVLPSEKMKRLKNVLQKAKLFKVTETLPSEKLDGANTYHFKFILDKEGMKNFFIEVGTIIQDESVTEKELTEFNKNFDAVEFPEGEIWIGRDDFLPRKLSLSFTAKETNATGIAGKVVFILSLKNFNQPIEVEIPAKSIPIEEFLIEFSESLGDDLSQEW